MSLKAVAMIFRSSSELYEPSVGSERKTTYVVCACIFRKGGTDPPRPSWPHCEWCGSHLTSTWALKEVAWGTIWVAKNSFDRSARRSVGRLVGWSFASIKRGVQDVPELDVGDGRQIGALPCYYLVRSMMVCQTPALLPHFTTPQKHKQQHIRGSLGIPFPSGQATGS